MRNPWAIENYHGPWHDADFERWTEQAREEADHDKILDDGAWFTTIEDFHAHFLETQMNVNVDNQKLAYWADFDTEKNVHEFLNIVSPVNQTIYVSAYMQDPLHFGVGDCANFTALKTWLEVTSESHNATIDFTYGYANFEPLNVTEGEEYSFLVSLRWTETDLRAHAYSFVVWSDLEEVSITSSDESKISQKFPNYQLDPDLMMKDFNGTIVTSSDVGNHYEIVKPEIVIVPDGPPEAVIREPVFGETFADSYIDGDF